MVFHSNHSYFTTYISQLETYTFQYINTLDPYIQKFVSVYTHSYHRYFIDTRPITTRPPLVRISTTLFVWVILSRLQRAYNNSYLAIQIAIRSISVSVSRRYSIIPLIGKNQFVICLMTDNRIAFHYSTSGTLILLELLICI